MIFNKLREYFSLDNISKMKQKVSSVPFKYIIFGYYKLLWLICILCIDRLLISTFFLTLFEFNILSNTALNLKENISVNFYSLVLSYILVCIQLPMHNPIGYVLYIGLSLTGYFSMLTLDQIGNFSFLQQDVFKLRVWVNMFKKLTQVNFWVDFKNAFVDNISKVPESWENHLISMFAGVCISFPYFKFVSNMKYINSIVLLPFGFMPHKIMQVFQDYEERSFKKNMD